MVSDAFYVELRNTEVPTYLTASVSDKQIVESHRWRYVHNKAVTVIPQDNTYVTATLDSLLLGVSRKMTVHHQDGNPLNYQRTNLKFFNSKTVNQYIADGDTTYLLIRNAHTVFIDTDQRSRVEAYTWSIRNYKGKPTVVADYKADGIRHTLQLARLLMGIELKDSRSVVTRDGDYLNCRLSNLTLPIREKSNED